MGARKRAVGAAPPGPAVPEAAQRRTSIHTQLRKTKLCAYFLKGACEYGIHCAFAHSCAELQATPDLRKTRLCLAFVEGPGCKDPNCSFAHGEEELRSTDMFYKKTLCIWNEKGKCRNGDQCRFAHGPAELRSYGTQEPPPAVAGTAIPGQTSGGGTNRRRGHAQATASVAAIAKPGASTAPTGHAPGTRGAALSREPMKVVPRRMVVEPATTANSPPGLEGKQTRGQRKKATESAQNETLKAQAMVGLLSLSFPFSVCLDVGPQALNMQLSHLKQRLYTNEGAEHALVLALNGGLGLGLPELDCLEDPYLAEAAAAQIAPFSMDWCVTAEQMAGLELNATLALLASKQYDGSHGAFDDFAWFMGGYLPPPLMGA